MFVMHTFDNLLSYWSKMLITCDLFTNMCLWVLGIAVSHINGSNCKLMSPEHYFFMSAIPLHPRTGF